MKLVYMVKVKRLFRIPIKKVFNTEKEAYDYIASICLPHAFKEKFYRICAHCQIQVPSLGDYKRPEKEKRKDE